MSNPSFLSPVATPVRLPTPCAYLVSYDLKSSNSFDYAPFFAELQSSKDWFHYLTNTWIILRYETLAELGPLITSKIHNQDRLLITPAKGPAEGFLPPDAWTWLNTRLKREW